jgi:hypothetical protein
MSGIDPSPEGLDRIRAWHRDSIDAAGGPGRVSPVADDLSPEGLAAMNESARILVEARAHVRIALGGDGEAPEDDVRAGVEAWLITEVRRLRAELDRYRDIAGFLRDPDTVTPPEPARHDSREEIEAPKVDEGLRSPRVVAWLEQDREQVRQEERGRYRSIGWAAISPGGGLSHDVWGTLLWTSDAQIDAQRCEGYARDAAREKGLCASEVFVRDGDS